MGKGDDEVMNLPKGYEWIKPGAIGLLPSQPLVVKFISEPYLSDVFLDPMWFADTEMGEICINGFIDAKKIPSEFAALSKARADLDEHADAVSMAEHVLTMNTNGVSIESISEALLCVRDALGGEA